MFKPCRWGGRAATHACPPLLTFLLKLCVIQLIPVSMTQIWADPKSDFPHFARACYCCCCCCCCLLLRAAACCYAEGGESTQQFCGPRPPAVLCIGCAVYTIPARNSHRYNRCHDAEQHPTRFGTRPQCKIHPSKTGRVNEDAAI